MGLNRLSFSTQPLTWSSIAGCPFPFPAVLIQAVWEQAYSCEGSRKKKQSPVFLELAFLNNMPTDSALFSSVALGSPSSSWALSFLILTQSTQHCFYTPVCCLFLVLTLLHSLFCASSPRNSPCSHAGLLLKCPGFMHYQMVHYQALSKSLPGNSLGHRSPSQQLHGGSCFATPEQGPVCFSTAQGPHSAAHFPALPFNPSLWHISDTSPSAESLLCTYNG